MTKNEEYRDPAPEQDSRVLFTVLYSRLYDSRYSYSCMPISCFFFSYVSNLQSARPVAAGCRNAWVAKPRQNSSTISETLRSLSLSKRPTSAVASFALPLARSRCASRNFRRTRNSSRWIVLAVHRLVVASAAVIKPSMSLPGDRNSDQSRRIASFVSRPLMSLMRMVRSFISFILPRAAVDVVCSAAPRVTRALVRAAARLRSGSLLRDSPIRVAMRFILVKSLRNQSRSVPSCARMPTPLTFPFPKRLRRTRRPCSLERPSF
jgi:hypothetical protein